MMATQNHGGVPLSSTTMAPITVVRLNKDQVIDGFHALIDGVKTRIFPATGPLVSLDALGDGVRWIGDNLGCRSDKESITIADAAGNWSEPTSAELLAHPVGHRLDAHSRKRIQDGLTLGSGS